MKRKFKLFATIASLCLSVALMAFGVYAATNVTYNVTSTVSFASQVTGTFNYEVTSAAFDTKTGEAITLVGNEVGNPLAKTATIEDCVFDLSKENGGLITYKFTFVNTSDAAAKVVAKATKLFNVGVADDTQLEVKAGQAIAASGATASVDAPSTDNATTLKGEAGLAEIEVAAGGNYVLVVTVELKDATKQLTADNNALNVTLTVTAVNA